MANAFRDHAISIRRFRPPIINEFAAVLPRDGRPSVLAESFLGCIAAELAEKPLPWVRGSSPTFAPEERPHRSPLDETSE
jgi:hypothetical protein